MSALGRAEGVGTDLGAGLEPSQEACPLGPIISILRKTVLGCQGNRGRGQVRQQEDPLGGMSCTHLKLFSKISFIS